MVRQLFRATQATLPGLILVLSVTLLSYALEAAEARLFGRAWLESLVLAIVLGTLIRSWRGQDSRFEARFHAGIQVGAKLLLEVAVVLLGASVSVGALLENGDGLVGGIAVVVVLAIALGFTLGRVFGLPYKLAILIACGNAICGNSAIAAVAPVIDADGKDVAAAIAFTAVLGVAVVLALPLSVSMLSFSPAQYGVFAGLTVYAVPQVLAATSPVALVSVHIGTLVKLVRVLMLGPVMLVLSLLIRRGGGKRPAWSQIVPWFIVGFVLMLMLRSTGAIPTAALGPMHASANFLTIMSMAALGLSVDARAALLAGGRVTAVVVLSLAALAVLSYVLIKLIGIA